MKNEKVSKEEAKGTVEPRSAHGVESGQGLVEVEVNEKFEIREWSEGQQLLYLRYYDETWGSCRHWQIVDSVRKVSSIDEARKVIESKAREGWTAAWEFSLIADVGDGDSTRNRHRNKFFEMSQSGLYVVRRWYKDHPSCNAGRWEQGFIYAIVEDGRIVEVH